MIVIQLGHVDETQVDVSCSDAPVQLQHTVKVRDGIVMATHVHVEDASVEECHHVVKAVVQ